MTLNHNNNKYNQNDTQIAHDDTDESENIKFRMTLRRNTLSSMTFIRMTRSQMTISRMMALTSTCMLSVLLMITQLKCSGDCINAERHSVS
jgi:hypothetical protein